MAPEAQPRAKQDNTRRGGTHTKTPSPSQSGVGRSAQAKPTSTREASKARTAGPASQPPRSNQPASKQPKAKWTRLGSAEKKLKESAKKLEELLPLDLLTSQKKEMEYIKGSADINALAESLGSVIKDLMGERDVEETSSGLSVIKVWVKKALPFIEKGLDIATVSPAFSLLMKTGCGPSSVWVACLRCPFCCPGSHVCFTFLANNQRLKDATEVPEKIENALTNISSSLSGIGISDDFPRSLSQELLDDIRASAIFLTVAIMNCLSAIIKWTQQNGFLFIFCLIWY
jgi:hypothetical protein